MKRSAPTTWRAHGDARGLDGAARSRHDGRTAREGDAAWVGYTFTGTLLNAVELWPETIHTEITARGLVGGELARVVDAADPLLQHVLTEKCPHRLVVDARGS